MKDRLLRFLEVEPDEAGGVTLLFIMGIFMGMFIATISVASQSLLLSIPSFSEAKDLPYTMLIAGLAGLAATSLYNFLQNRIPFPLMGALFLLLIVGLTAFMEYGGAFFTDEKTKYEFGFVM